MTVCTHCRALARPGHALCDDCADRYTFTDRPRQAAGYLIEGAFYCPAHARLEPGDLEQGYATPVGSAHGACCIGCAAPRRR